MFPFSFSFSKERKRTFSGSRCFFKALLFSVLCITLFSSCEREKKLFNDKDAYGKSFDVDNKSTSVFLWMHFDTPRTETFENQELTSYGRFEISQIINHNRYFVNYYLTDIDTVGEYNYNFKAICLYENLPKSNRRKKSQANSYIGDIITASVKFDPSTSSYLFSFGPCAFLGNNENWETSFRSRVNAVEGRSASNSILSKYFSEPIKVYPTKYLGDWVRDFEALILIALLIITVLAIVCGDWLTAIAIPIMAYLTLYTSFMVFLPFLPFLLLVPLSYIPRIPSWISLSVMASLLLGLYFLYLIYCGSTFWNSIVMCVVWVVATYVFLWFTNVYLFDEQKRCKNCGSRMHVNYYDTEYITKGMRQALSIYPRSNVSECSTVIEDKPTKQNSKICFHCNI